MKFLLTLVLIIISIIVKSQPIYSNYIINPFDYWSFGTSVIKENDTVYIQGEGGQTLFFRNHFISKLNSNGQIAQIKKIQRDQIAFFSCHHGLLISDFGFLTCGLKYTITDTCGYLYKLDYSMNLIDSVDLTYNDCKVLVFSIVKTLDNSFAVCGYLLGPSPEFENRGIILYKIDADLSLQWVRVHQPATISRAFHLVNTPDNGFLISGMKSDNLMFTEDPLVLKTDNNGFEQWIWDNGNNIYDDGPAVSAVTQDGGYLISYGHAVYQSAQWPPLPAQKSIRLVKIDSNGSELWSHNYGISNIYNKINNLLVLSDNTCLINCATSMSNSDMAVLVKTSSIGDSLWLRYYIYNDSTGSFNEIMDIVESDDLGFLTIGHNYNINNPGAQQSVWIMHLDSLGCQTPECNPFVGVKDNMILNVSCYPNPANKFVTFRIPVSKKNGATPNKMKASIYNNSGSFFETYTCDYSNEVTIDISHLLSGIYYISFFTDTELIGTAKVLKL